MLEKNEGTDEYSKKLDFIACWLLSSDLSDSLMYSSELITSRACINYPIFYLSYLFCIIGLHNSLSPKVEFIYYI